MLDIAGESTVQEKKIRKLMREFDVKCPACGNNLTEKKFGEVTVDVCEGGCGGVWFDWFEFKKVDEPHERVVDADVRRLPGAKSVDAVRPVLGGGHTGQREAQRADLEARAADRTATGP